MDYDTDTDSSYDDLTQLFEDIVRQTGSIDMAEAEFRRMAADDEELRTRYRAWCYRIGSTERNGFADYCSEYLSSQNSIWTTLCDYDE